MSVELPSPGPRDDRLDDVGRLLVRCPDRPGIVAVLSGLMADAGANIIDSQQHSSDPVGGTFTLRLEFVLAGLAARRTQLEGALELLAAQWQLTWRLSEASYRPRLAVFVSRTDTTMAAATCTVIRKLCFASSCPDCSRMSKKRCKAS